MESFSSFIEGELSLSNRWNSASVKHFRPIPPLVQNHLKLVYASLFCAFIASAVGVYVHLLWNIGGLLTGFACVGSIVWLTMIPIHEEKKKMSLFMAAALFEGASVAPLIDLAIEIDPSIIIFVGSAIAFGCYSAAAAYSRNLLEYMYLGGLLLSTVAILPWLSFASSVFGGHVAMFKSELYFGLVLFVWYMMTCTTKIMERIHPGDLDYIKHAMTLLTVHSTNVLVKMFKILMELRRSAGKDKKKRERFNLDFKITFRLRGGLE